MLDSGLMRDPPRLSIDAIDPVALPPGWASSASPSACGPFGTGSERSPSPDSPWPTGGQPHGGALDRPRPAGQATFCWALGSAQGSVHATVVAPLLVILVLLVPATLRHPITTIEIIVSRRDDRGSGARVGYVTGSQRGAPWLEWLRKTLQVLAYSTRAWYYLSSYFIQLVGDWSVRWAHFSTRLWRRRQSRRCCLCTWADRGP